MPSTIVRAFSAENQCLPPPNAHATPPPPPPPGVPGGKLNSFKLKLPHEQWYCTASSRATRDLWLRSITDAMGASRGPPGAPAAVHPILTHPLPGASGAPHATQVHAHTHAHAGHAHAGHGSHHGHPGGQWHGLRRHDGGVSTLSRPAALDATMGQLGLLAGPPAPDGAAVTAAPAGAVTAPTGTVATAPAASGREPLTKETSYVNITEAMEDEAQAATAATPATATVPAVVAPPRVPRTVVEAAPLPALGSAAVGASLGGTGFRLVVKVCVCVCLCVTRCTCVCSAVWTCVARPLTERRVALQGSRMLRAPWRVDRHAFHSLSPVPPPLPPLLLTMPMYRAAIAAPSRRATAAARWCARRMCGPRAEAASVTRTAS